MWSMNAAALDVSSSKMYDVGMFGIDEGWRDLMICHFRPRSGQAFVNNVSRGFEVSS